MIASTPAGRYDTAAIKRANPLDRVARDLGLHLKPAGQGRYWALCPFHDDRHTPNLHLDVRDPDDEHFHCYAGHCGAHGDVIDLVMRLEHLDFPAACAHLASRSCGTPLANPRPTPHPALSNGGDWNRSSQRRWERLTLTEQTAMNLAVAVYRRGLRGHAPALRYLRERGIPHPLIARCGLGWADGHTLVAALGRSRNPALLPAAVDLGLLRRGPDGRLRDVLASRVVVPEIRFGHCIWFIGRRLGHGVDPASSLKYLALPGERPVLGQECAVGAAEVFACEGVFDWLAALAHGLAAWCPCGTHVPSASLGFLARVRRVYGAFDGDAAGRAASDRLGRALGTRYRPLALPDGCDLADLLSQPDGRARLDALVADARSACSAPPRKEG